MGKSVLSWLPFCSWSFADGVDILGVVRHVGRLLDGNVGSRPAELVKNGDLVLLTGRTLDMRGRDTVRVSKVKGQADEGTVREWCGS